MNKWLTPVLFAGTFVALTIAERRWPLRRRVEPPNRRLRRNLAMAAMTAGVTAALQQPLVDRVMRRTMARRSGLLRRIPSPALRFVLGILLLDYTLWWWHWLNHTAPALWRFHVVHHADLDLDTSTAVRFHFGEMALAAFFRAAQVRLLGVDEQALAWWQRMLLLSILFHHSNLRLPEELDRRLRRLFVTPRMHGIHHSEIEDETNSNWSSLFTWWDFLHGTFREGVPQEAITIGVPGWKDPHGLGIAEMIRMPARTVRGCRDGMGEG